LAIRDSRNPFINIPERKLDDALDEIRAHFSDKNSVLTKEGAILAEAIHKYYLANIPVDYWWREMQGWEGPPNLLRYYEEIVKDIRASFKEGKRARFAGRHGIGKLQDLEAELPTPDRGFVKLKNLREGDKLFDENGVICNIIKLHPIDLNPESYLVTFDDGEKIKVCKDHLWLTWTLKDRRRKYLHQTKILKRAKRRKLGLIHKPYLEKSSPEPEPTVKSTQEIFETQRVSGKQNVVNHSIPVTKPLQYPEKTLPIHPYVLGCWLGDGGSYGGDLTTADPEILKQIHLCGFDSHLIPSTDKPDNKSKRYLIEGLHTLLNQNKLIKNKHIPREYLYASIEQRIALVQGLLDTDGYCKKSGLIEFCNTNENIANGFRELIISLGIKCNLKKGRSYLNGKRCKDRYRITFSTTLPVFRLKRKLDNQRFSKKQEFRTLHRYIVSVEPTESVPMRCITVDSPSHLYLITRSCIPTHNTMAACCILKRVVEPGDYSALYVNLTDIIHVMLTSDSEQKAAGREILLNVDFLVIDELDTRFMGSENAADLFGRILEPIMRTRIQNRMPLFFCTNSSKVEESFSGPLQASIESLMNVVKLVPVIGGQDAREKIKKGEL
jgi:hypothetical protein